MIKDYLNSKDILYIETGKNVSAGWVNMSCPFCEENSTHLGISPTGGFNCWVCGESGDVTKLIKQMEGCSWKKAIGIVKQFEGISKTTFSNKNFEDKSNRKYASSITLPKFASNDFSQTHLAYLKERDFNSRYLIHYYNLKATHLLGDYKFSIIIPIYLRGQLVNFTTINVKTNQKLHLSNEQSVVPIKSTLYNIDNITDRAIVVEGVSDVWRIGSPAVALFGKKFTTDQIKLLKNLKKIVVLLDSDANREGLKLANELSKYTEVEQIELPYGDPANALNSKDISYLKNILK